MTRDEQTDAIVEHRLAAKQATRVITNPDAIRSLIRGDLSALTAAEINTEYHRLHGGRQVREAAAKDYATTLLDRAISDALTMLDRPYLDHAAIRSVLTEDYDAVVAGQALTLALERRELPEPPPVGVKFVEYQATLGRAENEAVDA